MLNLKWVVQVSPSVLRTDGQPQMTENNMQTKKSSVESNPWGCGLTTCGDLKVTTPASKPLLDSYREHVKNVSESLKHHPTHVQEAYQKHAQKYLQECDMLARENKTVQDVIDRMRENVSSSFSTKCDWDQDEWDEKRLELIDEFNLNFNLGNCVKCIISQQDGKSTLKDLEQALLYLQREIERLECD